MKMYFYLLDLYLITITTIDYMKRSAISFLLIVFFSGALFAQTKELDIKLIHTSDLHGRFFSYDMIKDLPTNGGMARICTYVKEQRANYPGRVLLLDGGDLLQGQPGVYYYNYKDTISPHFCAEVMNYMKYDAIALGNHDIEAGHSVYDRWMKQCKAPILGANILRKDGTNYLQPYKTFVLDGVKVTVLGLITPSIPAWVPEKAWKGLQFDDMEKSARYWMKIIKEKEHPDIVIGLFHSGIIPYQMGGLFNENASAEVAKNVPGFDVVLAGHDHAPYCKKLVNVAGDSVLVIDPAEGGFRVSDIVLHLKMQDGKVVGKCAKGRLIKMKKYAPDVDFQSQFLSQFEKAKAFVNKPIGQFKNSISVRDAYFGPSAFVDLVHKIQLDITGADVSFDAPFSLEGSIDKGKVCVHDMFKLYEFENSLYTIWLTGTEIKNYLEMSYSLWINQMKSPDDNLLLLRRREYDHTIEFQNYSYNFDSAAGIIYTVDVTKPYGERVSIKKMANGKPFDLNKKYKVAINSYRASGGGDHLTKGAGIPHNALRDRVISTTSEDMRFLIMEWIEKKGTISPKPLNQWKFIPEDWVNAAAEKDKKLLFKE
jgi:5''-nucleotidase/2'',3''-cyclic phosphodiesterase and related esterases